ncbi:urea transporter [Acidiplasma cupricumulans]|uniref:urea transporter n=1 Tax=Acidiplasma cupricumulans TaxID=312540 RepID=UPI001584F84D|nr:urea transporter [Acidiplasma cupricumulans]
MFDRSYWSFFTAFITASLIHVTSVFGLPVETSGFVLTTWIILFAAYKFFGYKLAGAGVPPKQRANILKKEYNSGEEPIKMHEFTLGGFIKLIFTGISQVFFQENYLTGIIMVVGLTLATISLKPFAFGIQYPIFFAGVTAFIGSLVGTLTGIALKADRTSILMGLYGFNGVFNSISRNGCIPRIFL